MIMSGIQNNNKKKLYKKKYTSGTDKQTDRQQQQRLVFQTQQFFRTRCNSKQHSTNRICKRGIMRIKILHAPKINNHHYTSSY